MVPRLAPYASVADLAALWRPLTTEEAERAEQLLPIISATLRQEARNRGHDLEVMIMDGLVDGDVVKSVTVDIAARVLMTSTNSEPMTQVSQSALGYSATGTYLVPGGGLFIKRSELGRLGLTRQRLGFVDMYSDPHVRRDCCLDDPDECWECDFNGPSSWRDC